MIIHEFNHNATKVQKNTAHFRNAVRWAELTKFPLLETIKRKR